jgi:hypothetical protein
MMRTLFCVDYDHKRSSGGYGDKIWVRDDEAFPTHRLDFVGSEGNGAIEFANGGYDHEEF